ncbi:MAG TPA: hypothetical protein VF021_08680 [Longimicrobiales bacterium]
MKSSKRRISPDQKQILHDGVIFAVKLWLDGIKDVVLGFLALGAVLVDLIKGRQAGGFLFYKVMKLGHRVDHAIDVYGLHEPTDAISGTKEPFETRGD